MKRAWGITLTILAAGTLAACASIIGVDGDYEVAASSSGSSAGGGTTVSVTVGVGGSGGDPTTNASVAVSTASGAGGGGGAPPTSWHRYSFSMTTGTWSSAPLSSVWTGPNAPPSSGIVAACHLDHFDKLLVFTDTGMVHIQEASVWLPPVSAQTLFPQITNPGKIADLYHVPSDWNVTPMAMPLLEGLVIADNPTYWTYDFTANNIATFGTQGVIPPPMQAAEPPQDSVKTQWYFTIWNKSKIGTADGYTGWSSSGDGYVYELGADAVWSKWPIESGPLWAGKPGAPDWASLKAAYFIGHPADGIGTIVFIGP